MQLRHIFNAQYALSAIHRRFVSTVNVNVKSIGAVKIKPQDYLESSNDEVHVKLFDKDMQAIDVSKVKAIAVQSSRKSFQIDCDHCGGEKDLTMILELPIGSSPEIELQISSGESNIHVVNLQTKSISINTGTGNVSLKNLKSGSIKTETDRGNITTKSLLLGKTIKLMSRNGVRI